jgi:23S rRNA pseudouridine1911/1915/1917 synthase
VRLDLFLIGRHPELSRRRAREIIEKGQVLLGGAVVREPGREVDASAAVVWDPNRRALPRARISLPLLHEDDELLVVDKPAGLLSVPTRPGDESEDTALARVRDYARHLPTRRSWVGVVHRLDRDTSGALAFARSPAARRGLMALFSEHRIERRYLALVEGRPRGDEGRIDQPIADAYEGGRRRIARRGEPASPASTRFRVRETLGGFALLEVELETGRQHQIRLHLAHAGHPVVGDRVYRPPGRGRTGLDAPRQMLHAELLAFTHPTTGRAVRAESPLPADFRDVLDGLRRRAAGRR